MAGEPIKVEWREPALPASVALFAWVGAALGVLIAFAAVQYALGGGGLSNRVGWPVAFALIAGLIALGGVGGWMAATALMRRTVSVRFSPESLVVRYGSQTQHYDLARLRGGFRLELPEELLYRSVRDPDRQRERERRFGKRRLIRFDCGVEDVALPGGPLDLKEAQNIHRQLALALEQARSKQGRGGTMVPPRS